jgi:diaminopimelate epimerase
MNYTKYLKFSKMHVLGNDFMIIDAITQRLHLSPECIQKWSDRHLGIGFDQLLLLEPPVQHHLDFYYRVFNSDGNEVSQCGNGACCIAMFVLKQCLIQKHEIHISTTSSVMILNIQKNHTVQLTMPEPNFLPEKIPLLYNDKQTLYSVVIQDQTITFGAVSVGNPHCIIQVDDCTLAPIETIGPVLSTHPIFPENTNVSFMQIINRQLIHLRVYERGVGETSACGSGASAAVAFGIFQGKLDHNVTVILPGGPIIIKWDGTSYPLYLTAEPTFVYEGVINIL